MGSRKSSTTVYNARDYFPSELTALESDIYKALSPIANDSKQTDEWKGSTFGKAWSKAQDQIGTAQNTFNTLAGNTGNLQAGFNTAAGNAQQAANNLSAFGNKVGNYDTTGMRNVTNKITNLGDATAALSAGANDEMAKNNANIKGLSSKIEGVGDVQGDLAATMRRFTETGNVPSAVLENLNKVTNSELQSNGGAALNNLAKTGVMNSSVANRSLNQLSNAAANAYAQNYLQAYNSVLNGYQQTNNTLASQGDTYSKAISGYNTANQGVNDRVATQIAINNAANGIYGNALGGEKDLLSAQQQSEASKLSALQAALEGQNAVAGTYDKALSGNISNTNAAAAMPSTIMQGLSDMFAPVYNMWKDWSKSVDDGIAVQSSSGGK